MSGEAYSPGVRDAVSRNAQGDAAVQAQAQGRRSSTTGAAQDARIAWGKEWGAVTSAAAKRAREES